MTRISGCFILCCPHCGAWFRTPNYVSMNFMALEAWTDGYQAYSLMPRAEYMRLCTSCDQLYDRSEAIRINQLTDEEMHDTVERPADPPRHWLAAAWRKVLGAPAPRWEKKLKDSLPPPVAWLPLAETQQRLAAILENAPDKNPKAALFELELRIRRNRPANPSCVTGLV